MHREPCKPCDLLAGIRGERLALGRCIIEIEVAEVPEKAMSLRITKPLETIRQQRNGRVARRESLHGPAVVSDHDLVERESLLLARNEEVAHDLRDPNHDPDLPQPAIRRVWPLRGSPARSNSASRPLRRGRRRSQSCLPDKR